MDVPDDALGEVPTRPMRVKILYTFDYENKTNCLARIPDILHIPAVAIDDNTQVGVIELQQCLQAVVSASPEVVSSLGEGDFTIYAYDYSEYDTPLVGQGMLSAALGSAESTPPSRTMITGRVCKNMLALFSNGVKETLEVKLRLVPVPKPMSAGLAKGLDDISNLNQAVSSGFDPNIWNATGQHNRTQQHTDAHFGFDTLVAGGERDMALVDEIFGLGSVSSGSHSGHEAGAGLGMAETPSDANFGTNPAFAAYAHSAPGSRAGSPMIALDSSTRNELMRHQSFAGNPSPYIPDQSRPDSRASARGSGSSSNHQRQASAPSPSRQLVQQPPTEVFYNEDGQARKRIKVTQTDWHGRSSFGSKSSDLRVTASTAASMHMHRPIPKRPGLHGSHLEPPPRVPTPVPELNPMRSQQQQMLPSLSRRSMLRQTSVANSDFMSDIESFSDAIVSSPEDESPSNSITAEGTPQEIPSSPPVFPEMTQPQPSSPGLPTLPLPRMADSGYMSERGFNSSNCVESVEQDDHNANLPRGGQAVAYQRSRKNRQNSVAKADSRRTPAFTSDININLEAPGDMNQLPQKMLLNLPPGRREGSQGPRASKKSARSAASPTEEYAMLSGFSSRVGSPNPANFQAQPGPLHGQSLRAPSASASAEANASRRGSLALPPMPSIPPSDPSERLSHTASGELPSQRRQSSHRSRTRSNESEAGSPAPSDFDGRPRGPSRSGSGAQRRKVIEQKLQRSIQNGEMPTFCSHCGAIETPTWRRLYVRKFDGKPSPLDYQEGEGETVGVEVLETDENGDATAFAIRKAMKRTKDSQPGVGFEEVVVCNPCGLWFNKFRNMRPPEKWNRKVGSRRSKRSKENDTDLATDGIEPQSDMLYTDQVVPENAIDDADDGIPVAPITRPSRSATRRPRANSMQPQQPRRINSQEDWNASQLDAALSRAVQSSPVRFTGSQQSPIELDPYSAKPTRRLLFPSPRKSGEVKSLDDNGQASLSATTPSKEKSLQPSALSPKMDFEFGHSSSNIFEAFTSIDKENVAPPLDLEGMSHIDHLLGESGPSSFRTPRKTPSKPSATPVSQRQFRDIHKTPTSASRKRKPLSANSNAANNANMAANDFMTSPSSSRYFLRSTPSRLERTPGRASAHYSDEMGHEVSPWSRQMAQMLSGPIEPDAFTSPARNFDFSGLPTFTTPGRTLDDCDWSGLEEIMSSEFAAFGDHGHDETQPAHGE